MPHRASWSTILLIGFICTIALPLVWERTENSLKVYSLLGKFLRKGPVFQRTVTYYNEEDSDFSFPFQIINFGQSTGKRTTNKASLLTEQVTANMSAKTPVFFISHGGPNVMFEEKHQAYAKLQAIGHEITQEVKPKAIVVVSAHWQGEPKVIEVNTAEQMPLIYDFYGFPSEYYEVAFPNVGSPELAQQILDLLKANDIEAEGVRRGLDHGAWASFRVAFDPETNPANVPIVQVSLFDSDDADQHYRLGAALQPLREQGIAIVCSGMSVHNLRDMWRSFSQPGPMPYTQTFDNALKDAVEQPPENRQRAMAELLKRPDARRAHPDFDHLLPIHVAAGAAGEDAGKQIWTLAEGSMAWAQYRFGAVAA